MYECESWTIKKAKCQRIDAFELWCWRRLLRVPWTARRSNQSILKEISPAYSLEGLMLKLKLQHFGLLMQKEPDAGEDWGQEEKGRQRMRWLDGITDSMDVSLSELWECCNSWDHKESDMTERLNWTELMQGWLNIKKIIHWNIHSIHHTNFLKKIYAVLSMDTEKTWQNSTFICLW